MLKHVRSLSDGWSIFDLRSHPTPGSCGQDCWGAPVWLADQTHKGGQLIVSTSIAVMPSKPYAHHPLRSPHGQYSYRHIDSAYDLDPIWPKKIDSLASAPALVYGSQLVTWVCRRWCHKQWRGCGPEPTAAFRIQFSATRYSFRNSICWFTAPVMYARMRAPSMNSLPADPQPAPMIDLRGVTKDNQ